MSELSSGTRSRLVGLGGWTLVVSGLLPWFTAGAMSSSIPGARGWIALLAGIAALALHHGLVRTDRVDVVATEAGMALVALLAGASGLVVRPTALGPSVGVAVCIVGALLLGGGAFLAHRRAAGSYSGDPDHTEAVDDAIEEQGQTGVSEVGSSERSAPRRVARVTSYIVLIAVGIVVVWPAGPGDLGARAEPSADYDAAIQRFRSETADEPGRIFEPCESQLMTHGEQVDVAVVLFHGLTNCPKQFVEFGTQLHADGANVLILRAPGHGVANASGDAIGGLANVAGLTDSELREYADTAIDIGVGLGDEVRVLGLSMGGVISTWVAQQRSDVDRVVAVAPAMTIPTVPAFLTNLFRNVGDKLPNIDLPGESKLDHAYAGETTKGLTATFLMAEFVADSANERGPDAGDVIVVLNPDDNQVDPDHLAAFTQRWDDHGETVSLHRLPAVGLPHDVIDPDQPDGDPDLVYPILLELLAEGER